MVNPEKLENFKIPEDHLPRQAMTLEEFRGMITSFEEERAQKRPKNTLTHAQVVKLVVKATDYEHYEVLDVLEAYNKILQEAILQGRAVAIPNIGFFQPKYIAPHMKYIGITKEWKALPERIKFHFRFTKAFMEKMRYAFRKLLIDAGKPYDAIEIDYINSTDIPDYDSGDKLIEDHLADQKKGKKNAKTDQG